jgi:hypothetical protein
MKSQPKLSKEFQDTACFVAPWRSSWDTKKQKIDNLKEAYKANHDISSEERLPNGVLPLLKDLNEKIESTLEKEKEKFRQELDRAKRRWEQQTPEGRKVARKREKRERTKRYMLISVNKCGYKRSGSSWAGGDHDVAIVINENLSDEVWCKGGSEQVWSSNGKWSGSNSYNKFAVHANWYDLVYKRGLDVVDSMLTLQVEKKKKHSLPETELFGIPQKVEVFSASWVAQGRGFELVKHQGLIVTIGTLVFHAKSELAAKRMLPKRIANFESKRQTQEIT